ncbi:MAG: phosphate ABC transporter permease PstA, partial [Pirellulaceae bacterium]|nr:phosphate ABC transporter permease PstA [Pirellulaceae bacterium]
QLAAALDSRRGELPGLVAERLLAAVSAGEDGLALDRLWAEMRAGEETWLSATDVAAMVASLRDDAGLLEQLWGHHALLLLSNDVGVPMQRRLVRTGNYELTSEHFNWVSDFEILPDGQSRPPWALVLERLTWGRFYGEPQALLIDGQAAATQPAAVWASFLEHHPAVRARWRERRRLEIVDTGEVNRALEAARLELRDVELREGKNSDAWRAAEAAFRQRQTALEAEFAEIRSRIQALDAENERFQLLMATAQGEQKAIALADVVRAYPANQLTWLQRAGTYGARWAEFLLDDPREANSEGGVFPAIWGTVAMTLLMSVAVVPLGVLAALYLREYAKAGLLVSVVRIAVNNLAGVPSIVFGVFGLGFFCYIIGASLDQLFFSAKLPNPTFGTGGLMWAALTLALLTLPVVIVATEEALAAVPRSMREGSLACGATKFQTIRRIVLPRAMPGIMTGMILAMARGAGEVAPLMLVGAVKLAPELPVDGHFPFVHLERSFMHLGFHIYDLGFQSQNSEAAKPMVFTTTLLLIALIALMNLIAIGLRARLRRKFRYTEL